MAESSGWNHRVDILMRDFMAFVWPGLAARWPGCLVESFSFKNQTLV